jgi:hypothetical protein
VSTIQLTSKPTPKAICYARILNDHGKTVLDPFGAPVLLATTPFDDFCERPLQAIRAALKLKRGVTSDRHKWALHRTYRVKAAAKIRHRVAYDVVYVWNYLPETQRRADMNIAPDVLDPFTDSWYLEPIDNPAHLSGVKTSAEAKLVRQVAIRTIQNQQQVCRLP